MKNNIKKSIISHFKKRKSGELNINPSENKAIPQFIPSSLLNREKENQKDKISPVLSDVATALSAVTDKLSIFSKQNKTQQNSTTINNANKTQQNSTTINNANKNINSNIANNDRMYSYNYKTIQKIMSPNQSIPAKLNNMGVRPEQNVNNINNVKRDTNNFNKNIQILKKMHGVSLIQNKPITNKTNTQDITNDNQHTSVSNILNKKQTNVNKNASKSYRISKHTIQKIRDGRVNVPKEIKGYKDGGWIPPSDNGKGTLVAMAEGRDPGGEYAIPGKVISSQQKSKSLPEILQEKKSTSRTEPKNILNMQNNNQASLQIEKSMNKLNNLVKQIGNKNASSLGENASLKMEQNSNNRNKPVIPAPIVINNTSTEPKSNNNNGRIIQQNNRAFLKSQTAFPKWRQGFG